MAALPANPNSTISPAEMQILVSRAGLVLNPGQVADLVLAWRQVAGLIASLPHERPLADDMAYSFRVPPPAGATAAPARPVPAAARAVRAKPQPKSAKTKRPAKAKPRPKPAKAPVKAKARAKTRAKPARKTTAPRRASRGR